MKLCPDLDVKKFIPIFDMVKIDGFDLNMAIDDGGLASNCELLGKYIFTKCFSYGHVWI
jgi:hypothetical protein